MQIGVWAEPLGHGAAHDVLDRAAGHVVAVRDVELHLPRAGEAVRHAVVEHLVHHGVAHQPIVERSTLVEAVDDLLHDGAVAVLGLEDGDEFVAYFAHSVLRCSRTATLFCTSRRLSMGSTGCKVMVLAAAAFCAAKILLLSSVACTMPPVA